MKRIYALMAQDSGFQQDLEKDSGRLADGLWNAIREHIKRLQIHAEHYGSSHGGDLDSIWARTFNPTVTGALKDAPRLRISLMGTDCEHSFTWP
jgi:hypothetical protein